MRYTCVRLLTAAPADNVGELLRVIHTEPENSSTHQLAEAF